MRQYFSIILGLQASYSVIIQDLREFHTYGGGFICSRTFSYLPCFVASGIITQLTEQFDMSDKEAILTLSLFVTGYCVG